MIYSQLQQALSANIDDFNILTDAQRDQLDATTQLEEANARIASQFAGVGTSLGSITTRARAFGISLLDDVLVNIRAIGQEFENGNFLDGLNAISTSFADTIVPDFVQDFFGVDLGARQETIDQVRQQDADALAEQTEIENEQAARDRRTEDRQNEERDRVRRNQEAIRDAERETEAQRERLEREADQRGQSGSIADLNFQLRELNQEISRTSDVTILTQLTEQAAALEMQLESAQDLQDRLLNMAARPNQGQLAPLESIAPIELPDVLGSQISNTDQALLSLATALMSPTAIQGVLEAIEQSNSPLEGLNNRASDIAAENSGDTFREDLEQGLAEEQRLADERRQILEDTFSNLFGDDIVDDFSNLLDALELEGAERLEGIAAGLSGIVGGLFTNSIENQREQLDESIRLQEQALDESLDRRLEAAEGDRSAQLAIERDIEEERVRIAENAADERRRLARREILINGAVAAVQALANTALPFPASLGALIPIAAAVAAQLANLNSFADGGFTGPGSSFTDSTGHTPVGVVHDGEYVMPKRVLSTKRGMEIAQEAERLRKNIGYRAKNNSLYYEQGGFASMLPGQQMNMTIRIPSRDIDRIVQGVTDGTRIGSSEGAETGSRTGTRTGISTAVETRTLLGQIDRDTQV